MESSRLVPLLLLLALVGEARAQQANDSGTVGVSATVSGYVDINSGGPASLSGNAGGLILNNKTKGSPLTGLTINLGELGPGNSASFVLAAVPVRLRSNAGYSLTMSSSAVSSPDPYAVQTADIGFGLASISRTDVNVMAGTDTPAAGVLGNPTLDPDWDPSTEHWDYSPQKRLSAYATATSVLSGARIMKPVPASLPDGLTVNAFFCVKPQFFTPGSFSTTITFTISTP